MNENDIISYTKRIIVGHILLLLTTIFLSWYFFSVPLPIGILTSLVNGSAGYWTHRLGHKIYIANWYIAHVIGHHRYAYPAEAFDSTSYRVNTIDTYNLNFWMYIFIIGSTITITGIIFGYIKFMMIHITLYLVFENYIHEQIHLSNGILHKFKWFQILKSLHRIHHQPGSKHNYSVIGLEFDWLYGTLKYY